MHVHISANERDPRRFITNPGGMYVLLDSLSHHPRTPQAVLDSGMLAYFSAALETGNAEATKAVLNTAHRITLLKDDSDTDWAVAHSTYTGLAAVLATGNGNSSEFVHSAIGIILNTVKSGEAPHEKPVVRSINLAMDTGILAVVVGTVLAGGVALERPAATELLWWCAGETQLQTDLPCTPFLFCAHNGIH